MSHEFDVAGTCGHHCPTGYHFEGTLDIGRFCKACPETCATCQSSWAGISVAFRRSKRSSSSCFVRPRALHALPELQLHDAAQALRVHVPRRPLSPRHQRDRQQLPRLPWRYGKMHQCELCDRMRGA